MTTLERQSVFSQEIAASQNRPEWLQTMSRLAKTFGFIHTTLMKVPTQGDDTLQPVLLETTIPIGFIRSVDQHHKLHDCPILAKIANSSLPQYWCFEDDIPVPPYSAAIKKLMEKYGIVSGVIAPINGLNGRRYVLRLEGDCSKPNQTVLNEIGIVAIHAFDVYDRIRKAELVAPKTLTKREIEVIRWTSHGKTSSEIGQILSLSDHTINAYLNNAIKKLDCVNRTQLVAKAIRLKVIN
ncbi:DNA-binding CsgD family transcriptional regulator [Agrobacterium larrymoorei]|uniref:DNA-binding CsgD family transcriptional regulator n=1 Tax=Agrobacterium larrymoorei TaxID=160699 RepID=A0AAJ2BDF4_9HYPH|nr:LuxR C-terminal-related transcriptional regulator [Agrobacterium larrymoorei]MDR6102937.1 DNA-binding CsgD family transcriptional regulator [Agrobacterium larrymoorei]